MGDDDAARAYLRTIDWVLRAPAKRRLERALIDAALATNELGSAVDPEAARHVQRVAALDIAGVQVDVTDRAKVLAASQALRPEPPPRVWIATIISAALFVAVSTTVALAIVFTRAERHSRHFDRPLPPPAAGAFKDGGQPLADPAIAKLLSEDVMQLVIESDQDRRDGGTSKERKQHGEALLAPPAIVSHGPALAAAWHDMIQMLDRWVYVPTTGRTFDEISTQFRHQVRAVSDQLAAAGIGYYLEGDVLRSGVEAHALIYSYRVEEVVFVKAAEQPRRVLSLRRIDKLNFSHSLLGMESEDLGDPVLLLDQIDEHVASKTLPVLAPAALYPLGDDGWKPLPVAQQLGKVAGEAVRRELDRALGPDADAAHQIAALVAERASIVEQWRSDLERRNMWLARTDELFLPDNMLAELDGVVPTYQRERVAAIEDELAKLDAARVASRIHQLVAASVRRHEAQHGLDDERDPPLAYPHELVQHIGALEDEDGKHRDYQHLVHAELSAYTSQIANDPVTPELAYWHVAGFAFDRNAWGSPESYVGVIVSEHIAEHLKIASPGEIIHDGEIDRERLAQLATPIAAADPGALREAARATFQDLFGEPLVPIR